jgi:RNA polymerase sigma-70 factor (ECF subfamily)
MQKMEFAPAVTEYAYALKPFAISLTKDVEDAHDLIHETILLALTNKARFMPGSNMKAWLYTIMKNIFINNYRRRKKHNSLIDSTGDIYYVDSTSTHVSNIGESNLATENISFAVNKLKERFRVPFMMSYQGFKYHEIAEHLAIPIGTVKGRIHFARKVLKTKLELD